MVVDFFLNLRHKLFKSHSAEVAVLAASYRDDVIRRFLVADNEHIRDFVELRLTDLIADLFVSDVGFGAESAFEQRMAYFFRDGRGTVGKTQYPDLFGSKPRRHCAGVLFKQQRDRAFIAAHRRAVNDVRTRFLAVFVDIVHIETLRQEHIDLNGYERVFLSVHVFDLNVEFRTIERRLCR